MMKTLMTVAVAAFVLAGCQTYSPLPPGLNQSAEVSGYFRYQKRSHYKVFVKTPQIGNEDGGWWSTYNAHSPPGWLPEPEFCRAFDGLSQELDGGLGVCNWMDKEQKAIDGASMRVLWGEGRSPSSSRRPRSDEQFTRELADAVCELPHEMA